MPRRFVSIVSMLITLVVTVLLSLMLESGGLVIWAQRLPIGSARDFLLEATAKVTVISNTLGLVEPRVWTLAQRERWSSYFFPEQQTVSALESANQDASAVQTHMAGRPTSVANAIRPDGAPSRTTVRLRVALVGDSMMAVGLAPILQQRMSKDQGFFIIPAYRSGTGLIRPDVFDWTTQYPHLLADVKPDIVICAIGANDAQNVQVDRSVLQFNTLRWRENYAARVRSFAQILTADGAQVLWIGMPIMREPGFASKMAALNDVVREAVNGISGVSWIDPNPWLTDSAGRFLQYSTEGSRKLLKLRTDDGIHLSEGGAKMIAAPILDWVRKRNNAN